MAFPDSSLIRSPGHYIEAIIDYILSMDPESYRELSRVKGRTIGIEVIDTRLTLHVVMAEGGIRFLPRSEVSPDVLIRGTAAALLGYLFTSIQGKARSSGSIEIIGDVNLAQEFQSIMKRFEPDWEEALSRWTGDAIARKFGNFARNSVAILKKGARTIELDISEYLRFETEAVPDKSEINDFFSDLEKLRDDVERLKVRITRLR